MIKLRPLALLAITIALIAAKNLPIYAQAASPDNQRASIAVIIALDQNHVPVGQSPWAILTLKNLSDHDVVLHDSMIRAHVEDEKGERPMTRVQRNITHKLLPREAPLPGVGGSGLLRQEKRPVINTNCRFSTISALPANIEFIWK
jgi:hypothetical protein